MHNCLRMFAAAAIALAPAAGFAQTAATGNLEGVVADATGAVLPGVTVVVRNMETNLSREVVTDEGGRYRAAALQPGTYEITATLSGFSASPIPNVAVLVGQTQPVDIKAIKEFQVGISNFSAEFGRAAGGTVNAVTKSGKNTLFGEGFYFLRDDAFMRKDPFTPFKPSERRQQFGASVGGPIRRDRVFYFVNGDQQLRNFPYFVRPSQATFLPEDGSVPAACTARGCAATVAFYNSLTRFFPREGNNRILLGKVDYAINAASNLTVQYNLHRWNSPSGVQTQPVISVAESANGKDIVKTDFALFTLNTVLSSKWLNEARVQIGRDFEAQTPNAPGPSTTINGGISIGMPNFLPRPKYPDEWRYQIIDNISWYAGPHSLKAGVDVNYVREDLINLFQGGGVYNYTSLNNIALDCPVGAAACTPTLAGASTDLRHYGTFSQAFDLRGAGFQGDVFFTTTDYNAFIQDNWRVSNQLTLNLGLRYEYQQLPQPGGTSVRGVTFGGNPAYPATTRFNQDKNNWGPRAGFTYDINGRHTTIVRGGYGLYYGRTSNSAISSALTNNAVTLATYSMSPTTPGAPQYPSVFSAPPSGSGLKPTIQYLSPTLQRPTIRMGELSVDRVVRRDITLTASYLYSRGRHLPTFLDTNLNQPNATVEYFVAGQGRGTFPFFRGGRPDSNIRYAIEVADVVESTYHGFVLQANKRFSKGLLFNVNYTLSKSEDTGQNSTTFISNFATVVNPFDVKGEKGPALFDRRHRFVASFHYAPDYLYGVQVGGTGTIESGLPLNPSISGSVSSSTGAVETFGTNGTGGSDRPGFEGRNSYRQRGRKTIDLRLSKSFDAGGRRRLQVLWEAFNVLNTKNYTSYGSIRYRVASSSYDAASNRVTVNLNEDTGFGRPTAASNTLFGPRDQQLGLKFIW